MDQSENNNLVTNLQLIADKGAEKVEEHERFRSFIKAQDSEQIDTIVHRLNESISARIDCTSCGQCCRSLMVNISKEEAANLADHLKTDLPTLKEKYLEESLQGQLIMNTIPCHFLAENKCSIYEHRFHDCRAFPHLDRPHFSDRLFGTLIHYSMCPIIYNVVEQLKVETGFEGNV